MCTWKAASKCLSFSFVLFLAVDGDPHFVVDFPLSKLTVCFNIDGQPRDILRLVSDHMGSGKFCLSCRKDVLSTSPTHEVHLCV